MTGPDVLPPTRTPATKWINSSVALERPGRGGVVLSPPHLRLCGHAWKADHGSSDSNIHINCFDSRPVSGPGRRFKLFVALYHIVFQDQAGGKQTTPSRLETVLSVPLPCTSSPLMWWLCDLRGWSPEVVLLHLHTPTEEDSPLLSVCTVEPGTFARRIMIELILLDQFTESRWPSGPPRDTSLSGVYSCM